MAAHGRQAPVDTSPQHVEAASCDLHLRSFDRQLFTTLSPASSTTDCDLLSQGRTGAHLFHVSAVPFMTTHLDFASGLHD